MVEKHVPKPAMQLTCSSKMPDWADRTINLWGRLPLSRSHFTSVVALQSSKQVGNGGAVLEALLYTGGARTVIDEATTMLAKLPIIQASKKRDFGWFYGPSGESMRYAGIVEGPVYLRFSKYISITLPEMKIVENKGPIVLIGMDTMVVPSDNKAWHFAHMGFDPRSHGSIV